MIERYYSIHDIVKFKITALTVPQWKLKNITGMYANFEVPFCENVDFDVIFGEFDPSNEDCIILENNVFVKKDYLYVKRDTYKFTHWEFELSDIEGGHTTIRIHSNTSGYLWMAGFIVEFIIHFKLNLKGYSIVHASGISKGNRCSLFAARGGGGKTTVALNLLDHKFDFLGDNFVIIYRGNVYSYITPLNIFAYNVTPLIARNLSISEMAMLKLKVLIYTLTGGYVKVFTKINPTRIIPESISKTALLSSVLLLIPQESVHFSDMDRAQLFDALLFNQMLDTLLFMPYIIEYSFIYPQSNLAYHWMKYRSNLDENIPQTLRIRKVEVPQRYESETIKVLMDAILSREV